MYVQENNILSFLVSFHVYIGLYTAHTLSFTLTLHVKVKHFLSRTTMVTTSTQVDDYIQPTLDIISTRQLSESRIGEYIVHGKFGPKMGQIRANLIHIGPKSGLFKWISL